MLIKIIIIIINIIILLKDASGDAGQTKNYRPIVLLSAYGKILEKLIKEKILQTFSPLHLPAQFGFVQGRSTSDALIKYKNQITRSTKKYIMTIFVDVKGAFDNLWWPALSRAIRNRGAPNKLTAIIKNYLTNREVIYTRGNRSVSKKTTKGCPQGSVLGPTLWNLLLDELLGAD